MVERAAPIIAKHARIPQHTELIAINAAALAEPINSWIVQEQKVIGVSSG